MTFLSVLEVIALFAVAAAGFFCAAKLDIIAQLLYMAGKSQGKAQMESK